MSELPSTHQEIIIVRRGSGDGDGGHHGGAWKIAYADFVTAMMAFFLVMWLINSANEVTKSRVASYFNPIKMTDAAPSGRGLKSLTEKKAKAEKEEKEAASKNEKSEPDSKENPEEEVEETILKDPIAALNEIAAKAVLGQTEDQNDIISRSVGDPFDPKAWEALRNGRSREDSGKPRNDDQLSKEVQSSSNDAVRNEPIELRPARDVPVETSDSAPSQSEGKDKETAQLESTLKNIVNKHKVEIDVSVSVRKTDEGLLIILGDNSGKGMFGIGSAKPSAGLIDIVGVIGKLLSQQPGGVVVRGHTDARKYRDRSRDNWQLSTTRAHMASYMLMRGGLDESRIRRIEGHGAANLLTPSDPSADPNRRVEFLLSADVKKQ